MDNKYKSLGYSLLGGLFSVAMYHFAVVKNNQFSIQSASPFQNPVYTTNRNIVAAEEATDFTKAAENTVNAVVHVKNISEGIQEDPFAEFFFGKGFGGGQKYEKVGTGSGVIISSDGYIITNNHVVESAKEIEITLNNKKKYKAKLIGTDKANDIALIKIDATDLDYVPFGDSDDAKVGEWVLAVGNPYNLTSTVTAGIISAKGRDLEGNNNIESFIQTDAAVNPGNSGGALVNTKGQLIGINTAITSQTGSFVGYSFAVPSNVARKIVEDIKEFGDVHTAVLGVSIENKPDIEGVYVSEITKNSGADKAGLKVGDVIVKINNVPIRKFSDLKGQLNAKRPGDVVSVTVKRDNKNEVFSVKLSEASIIKELAFGIEFSELSNSEKEKLKISNGLKVVSINNEELEKLGIQPGYVIVQINGFVLNSITDIKNVEAQIKNANNIRKIVVINNHGEKETFAKGW